MIIKVLGSSAGGGLPQWNCNCFNCDATRKQKNGFCARSQSSIAISDTGKSWILINASPDIRTQIEAFPQIRVSERQRGSNIAAVVLTDSQIDHCTGLLHLREHPHLKVYCTRATRGDLNNQFPLFKILSHYQELVWFEIELGSTQPLVIPELPAIEIYPIILGGKAPPYSFSDHAKYDGCGIALLLKDKISGGSCFFAPGLDEMTENLLTTMKNASCLLIDGTFWQEDEMITLGVGRKAAKEMGHIPLSGSNGLIGILKKIESPRKILIHINNTNPILNEHSHERSMLTKEGIEVSFDGMEIHI
jgi:pyrroloquinoline quinone biosynthesis protein B